MKAKIIARLIVIFFASICMAGFSHYMIQQEIAMGKEAYLAKETIHFDTYVLTGGYSYVVFFMILIMLLIYEAIVMVLSKFLSNLMSKKTDSAIGIGGSPSI
ncbi:MAG TPA: hypothetical protein VFA55_05675 [Candidatus Kapabacteria bacterium]|nr:hypothetical protein [Candidatus Kapabacteria bacterium]